MHQDNDAQGPGRVALPPAGSIDATAELLRRRRSTKAYRSERLDVATLSALLRSAFGAGPDGRRPYGSAHARYDITVTVVAAAVDGLPAAAYRYRPVGHELIRLEAGDHRRRLAQGALDAPWLAECPVVLLLSADLAAANEAFDAQEAGRGERFCWFEAGLAAQNVYLWAAEHALGTVFLGGLDSVCIRAATRRLTPSSHTVLGMLPVGRPRRGRE